jgi:hypothetical protein
MPEYRQTFLQVCQEGFEAQFASVSPSMRQIGREYCDCSLRTLERNFKSGADADKASEAVILQMLTPCIESMQAQVAPAGKDIRSDALGEGTVMTADQARANPEFRTEFMKTCMQGLVQTLTDRKARAYCECGYEHMLDAYPQNVLAFDKDPDYLAPLMKRCGHHLE